MTLHIAEVVLKLVPVVQLARVELAAVLTEAQFATECALTPTPMQPIVVVAEILARLHKFVQVELAVVP